MLDEAVAVEELGTWRKGFSCLPVAEQLFAVLMKLWWGLESLYVSIRFEISETTMFTTWIKFYLKNLELFSHFHQGSRCNSGYQLFLELLSLTVMRLSHLACSISQRHIHSMKFVTFVRCTPKGLISFVSEAWGGIKDIWQRTNRKVRSVGHAGTRGHAW